MVKPASNDPMMTVGEVAKQLRVDDTTVRRWIKEGALEAVVLPHKGERQAYRIKREDFENMLANGGWTI